MGKAASKKQRRMFGIALSIKRGETPKSYIDKFDDKTKESILTLSKLSEKTLEQYAGTKQKKRKKDGTISKRNAIPDKVKPK